MNRRWKALHLAAVAGLVLAACQSPIRAEDAPGDRESSQVDRQTVGHATTPEAGTPVTLPKGVRGTFYLSLRLPTEHAYLTGAQVLPAGWTGEIPNGWFLGFRNEYRGVFGDFSLEKLASVSSLSWLDLFYSEISDKGLAHLAKLPSLRSLHISYSNGVTDAGMADIGRLTQLTDLRLKGTSISDNGITRLAGLENLQSLEISVTDAVSGDGFARLKNLTELKSLRVCHTGLLDENLVHFSHFSKLTTLDIGNNESLTGEGLVHLAPLYQLRTLDLTYEQEVPTELTDDGIAGLRALPRLTHLSLQGCDSLTAAGYAHIEGLPCLEHLNLRCANVTDEGLAFLKKLERLEYLSLGGCDSAEITDEVLESLYGLQWLEVLEVYSVDGFSAESRAALLKKKPRLHIR